MEAIDGLVQAQGRGWWRTAGCTITSYLPSLPIRHHGFLRIIQTTLYYGSLAIPITVSMAATSNQILP